VAGVPGPNDLDRFSFYASAAIPVAVLDPAVVSQLVGKRRQDADPLALMAEGRSNKAIAERLFVSEYTVQKHVGNIVDTQRLPPPPRTTAASWPSSPTFNDR
jgi:DNA-binding NarL/FixJ family response regulator